MSQFENLSDDDVDDLRLFEKKDGDYQGYLVYSFELDALTTVTPEELAYLRQRGVQEIDALPE